MNNLPRKRLCALIKQHGAEVYQDKKRCKAFLLDYCGEYQREIFVLTRAVEQGIPSKLLSHNQAPKLPLQALVTQLKNRLQDCYALTETAALWAVESWAVALSIVTEKEANCEELTNSLFFAVLVGKVELVNNLLQSGVDVNAQDKEGRTPLIYSILANQQLVAEELINAGADLEIIDDTGHSALHWAIMLGEIEIVKLLLQAGADVCQPNKAGNQPWEIAANYNQQIMKEILQQVRRN